MKKKFLAIVLAALMAIAAVPATGFAAEFPDVAAGSWYADAVKFVSDAGLMNGTGSGFAPDAPTTRGMVVTILYRMAGSPAANTYTGFYDVPENEYYAGPIAWALYTKVATGYSDTKFGPNDSITREQMAAFFHRYAAYCGFDTTERTDISKFSDASEVHSYALDSVRWAYASGLLNGTSETTLDPLGNATRAQIATNIQRFDQKFAAKKTGTSDDLAAAIGQIIAGAISGGSDVSISYDEAQKAIEAEDEDSGAAVRIAKDTKFYTLNSKGEKSKAKVNAEYIEFDLDAVADEDVGAGERADADTSLKNELKEATSDASLYDADVGGILDAANCYTFDASLTSIVDGEKNTEFHTLGNTTLTVNAAKSLGCAKGESENYAFYAVHTNIDGDTEAVSGSVSGDSVSFRLSGLSRVYIFRLSPHEVRFKDAGGSDFGDAVTVAFGGTVSLPAGTPAAPEGKAFDKWNAEALAKAKYIAVDVNPVWKDNETAPTKYTVSFNSNGGSEVVSQQVEAGGKAVEPAVPSHKTDTSLEFGGWYPESDTEFSGDAFDFANTVITGDITLVAKWN